MHTALLPVGKHGTQGEGFGGIVEGVGVADAFSVRGVWRHDLQALHIHGGDAAGKCLVRPFRIPRADLETGKTGCQFSGKRISPQSIRCGNPSSALQQNNGIGISPDQHFEVGEVHRA